VRVVLKSYSAGGNRTLCVGTTLVSIEITLCVLKSHSTSQNHTRTCRNLTLRVEITLRV
jgi:hypothetical protein